eukprot:TRINITY_DN10856_c0_g1_i1.p1 TRINITY_DN10856_c0_g1~~TRINITY_DN10856_c0_g1_i1.p1  ORF type:complete len:734 (-),score=239.40 TRINITY_DN10856_c0_g1_i1:136-2337(-)
MRGKMSEMNSNIEGYKAQIRELMNEKEAIRRSLRENQESMRLVKDEEISSLQGKLDELKKKSAGYNKKIKDLESNKKDTDSSIQNAQQESHVLNKKVNTLEALSRRLESDKSKAEKALEEAEKSRKTLQSKYDKLNNEKGDLSKKMDGMMKESKSGSDKTSKAVKDIEQRLKEKENELSKKNKDFDKDISDLKLKNQREISEFIAKMNTLTKEKSDLMSKISDQARKLMDEKEKQNSKYETLKAESIKAKTDLKSLQDSARPPIEVELKQLIENGGPAPKIKTLILELASKMKPVNGEISNHLRMTEELKVHLKDTEDELGVLSKTLEEKDGALSKLREENEELNKSLSEKKSSKKVVSFASAPEKEDDRLKELEEALQAAKEERQELLEAAEKEIEYHRLIAAEIEQNMIDDFEWKLHEIESEYNQKLKNASSLQASSGAVPKATHVHSPMYDIELFEKKLREATNEITRQKDEEFTKLHVQLRREMDDKLRLERNSLKTALDGVHSSELKKSNDEIKRSVSREYVKTIEGLRNEISSLQSQKSSFNDTIQRKDDEIIEARKIAMQEGDEKAFKERCNANALAEKYEQEKEVLGKDFAEELSSLRAEHEKQISSLESRLDVALGAKLEHMMALRDEVEEEYVDRMEVLRDMYKDEISAQSEGLQREKNKFHSLEKSLQETLRLKREEIESLSSREVAYKCELEELRGRLQRQTEEVLRLQTELEEYEYEDAL